MTAAQSKEDSLKVRTATIVVSRNEEGGTKNENTSAAEKRDTFSVVLTPDLKLGFYVKSLAGLY